MAGVCKCPFNNGKYKSWYMDWRGKQKFFVGTTNPKETLAMARRFEDDHRQIRLGYRPVPKLSNAVRDFRQVADEYLAWGNSQGGRGGYPWSHMHSYKRMAYLKFWEDRLRLKTLHDLDGILPKVERVLRELKLPKTAGKTLFHYAEGLSAFCGWCVTRGYLENNPLKDLADFDLTPKSIRRALIVDEVQKLLNSCIPHHRLLYEVAIASGLRAGELANLTVDHLDTARGSLRLDAEWTKNRKADFQPIPANLIVKLADASKGKAKTDKLLRIGSHPARDLDDDLRKAGIPKVTDQGKIDFHSLRVTFVSFVIEAGATVKEAQTLARHATPDLTMNTYARANPKRLFEIAERIQIAAFQA